MKYLGILLSVTLLACSGGNEEAGETKTSGRRIGSLKGLQALEDVLNERLLLPGAQPFNLRLYLDKKNGPTGLAALLGAFSEIAGFSVQEKAVPNPVNSLLWELVSARIADDIAGEACRPLNTIFSTQFYAAANALCKAPDKSAMAGLWLSLARYDAPEVEFKLWLEEESEGDGILVTAQGEERLSQLLQTILMNPYFMLEH